MQIMLLESYGMSPKALADFEAWGEVKLYDERVSSYDEISILYCRLGYYIGYEFLKKFPNISMIISPTTGLNHIDMEYINTRAIKVVSLKGEADFLKNVHATPEHTLLLILMLRRNIYKLMNHEQWSPSQRDHFRGQEVYNSHIGLVGYGRVGTRVGNYLKAMGAVVYYYDPLVELDLESKYDDLEGMIKQVDTIVLTASYEGRVIINKQAIDLMKDKYFINTSRGELIDQDYFLDKLILGHFKGVAIDVLNNEQQDEDILRLLATIPKEENFIYTPHIGGATWNSMHMTEEFIVRKAKGMWEV